MSEANQEFYSFSAYNLRGNSVFHVVNRLRLSLLTGEYPKGTKIREIPLAEQYGVSRGTVRTALQKLESEGLVLRLPNGRRISQGFDLRQIKDLYEVRRMLELKAAETILKFPELTRHKTLTSLASLARRTNRTQSGDRVLSVEERIERDADLHRFIVVASGNYSLLQCWKSIEAVMWTILHINATLSDPQKHFAIYKGHDNIVDLLFKGDDRVLKALGEHIDLSENLITDFLLQLHQNTLDFSEGREKPPRMISRAYVQKIYRKKG